MTWLGDNNVNCGYLGASRAPSVREPPLSRETVRATSVLYEKSKGRNGGGEAGCDVCVCVPLEDCFPPYQIGAVQARAT